MNLFIKLTKKKRTKFVKLKSKNVNRNLIYFLIKILINKIANCRRENVRKKFQENISNN